MTAACLCPRETFGLFFAEFWLVWPLQIARFWAIGTGWKFCDPTPSLSQQGRSLAVHSVTCARFNAADLLTLRETFGLLRQVLGLFKGMASPLYGLTLINAIVFGVEGNIQRRLSNPDTLTSHFIAGCVAGAAQCVVCSPMELAKTRMQIQGQGESRQAFLHTKHDYKGPVDCLVKIFQTEGIPGVFRGMGLTVVRETPSFGVYFVAYEYFCKQFKAKDREKVGVIGLLTAGGIAGMLSWISTYPVDVIKSRVQADMKGEYRGFWDCCVKSYQCEGLRVFGKGLYSTLLRAFPVNAATFGGVELVLRYAKDTEDDDDASYSMSTCQNQLNLSSDPNTTSTPVPVTVSSLAS